MAVPVSDPLAAWWVHEVIVERFQTGNAYGDSYDDAETVTGFVVDGAKLVTGPAGDQVVSTARIALPITAARVPVNSRVTLPAVFGARTGIVVASAVGDGGGRPTPDHHEIAIA